MQAKCGLASFLPRNTSIFVGCSIWAYARLICVFGTGLVVFSGLILSPVFARDIDAATAYSLSTKGELIIVDIRRSSEWRKTGMPVTSHGISLHNFLKKVRNDFTEDVVELVERDTSRPIALICATGGRSAYALELLQEAGFSRVFNISEGMLGNGAFPGWIARDLPVRKCDNC